jgi:superfamily II DNA or RNA helicase
MFLSQIEVYSDDHAYRTSPDINCNNVVPIRKEKSLIELRDYQQEAYECCIRDLASGIRSSLLVLATGLGKTILFSKIIEEWQGRVLVLVEREELLQNAYTEIEQITGEIIGIERQQDHADGERVIVAMVQTLSLRLENFSRDHFKLIIVDEAHHSASDIYGRILDYFGSAKVIGLTATDARADGRPLPFERCSYRMGIAEGIAQGYLVPIRGRRVIVDSINLSRVKTTSKGDFDEQALDDEMVKGAAAIADIIWNDHAFDKGILFFPGCASAKLTSEFLNKKSDGLSVYIDGKIVGSDRRLLVSRLRNGESNWLCNVGIATEGFNWPEAAVVGMCCPTTSRTAYVQRAGRGTRTLGGLLNGLQDSASRSQAIMHSQKPYMTILDFVGVSANLNLISFESALKEPEVREKNVKEVERKEEAPERDERLSEEPRISLAGSGLASRLQSQTFHSIEEFDPLNDHSNSGLGSVELKSNLPPEDPELVSVKQLKILSKFGISDSLISRKNAGKLMGYIAGRGFRLTTPERAILRKLYESLDKTDP